MARWIDSVIGNRDDARKHFVDCGLSYSKVFEGDIAVLVEMLNKELRASNKRGETSVSTITLSAKIQIKTKSDGSLASCFLSLNSHYFTNRECISFYPTGRIDFAGWADDGNVAPILRAFLNWCDYVKECE